MPCACVAYLVCFSWLEMKVKDEHGITADTVGHTLPKTFVFLCGTFVPTLDCHQLCRTRWQTAQQYKLLQQGHCWSSMSLLIRYVQHHHRATACMSAEGVLSQLLSCMCWHTMLASLPHQV